jgi:glycosyltransferase involved in cell wall biosynthesis
MRNIVQSVSVVTVTFNARDNIRLTLESVKRQKGCIVTHVVIDGGSTDGTQSVITEYDLEYFVSEPDGGVYPAMEKGAKQALGDIIIFLNAGDVFYDDTVCRDAMAFFNEVNSDIVFGNILPVYLNKNSCHDHPSFSSGVPLNLGYCKDRAALFDESIHHQSIFYRKWIFSRASYIALDPIANGEYNLLLSSVCWFCAKVKYFDRCISRFALGGISTGNFELEWDRYIKARDFLRALYFRNIRPPSEHSTEYQPNEFHIYE